MIKTEISENKRFIFIFVDEELWRKIDKKLYIRHLGRIRKCGSKKELEALFAEIEPKMALGYVYRLLALKGWMTEKLRKKMEERLFDEQVIEGVIKKCTDAGYLDDQKEMALMIEREKRQKQGPKKIELQLRKAFVSGEESKVAAREAFSEKEQSQMIAELLAKRFPDLSELKIRQRAFRFLQRRGFDESLIYPHVFEESERDYW